MSTLGQKPATQHVSTEKQTITGNGGTSYTLSQAVANENEVEIFVNNVRQEGGSGKAYTVSANQITFSEAVTSSDSIYVIFQGKAIQTVVPPDGSVTSAKLATAFPSASLDMNGTELILDADGDTSITADTDDRIDIKVVNDKWNTEEGGKTNNLVASNTNSNSNNMINSFDLTQYRPQ